MGKVPDPAQEIVGDTRRSTGTTGNLKRPLLIDLHPEQPPGAEDDFAKLLRIVVIEATVHSETRTKGGADHARTGGGTDQRESGEVQADTSGIRPLVDHDIDTEVLHGRVKILLDGRLQAMDLVNEENSAPWHRCQKARQITGFFNGRAACRANFSPHRVAKDIGQRGLPEPRGAAQEDVLERFVTLARCLDEEHETLDGLGLPAELLEHRGAQRDIKRCVRGLRINGKIF